MWSRWERRRRNLKRAWWPAGKAGKWQRMGLWEKAKSHVGAVGVKKAGTDDGMGVCGAEVEPAMEVAFKQATKP